MQAHDAAERGRAAWRADRDAGAQCSTGKAQHPCSQISGVSQIAGDGEVPRLCAKPLARVWTAVLSRVSFWCVLGGRARSERECRGFEGVGRRGGGSLIWMLSDLGNAAVGARADAWVARRLICLTGDPASISSRQSSGTPTVLCIRATRLLGNSQIPLLQLLHLCRTAPFVRSLSRSLSASPRSRRLALHQ